MLVTAPLAAAAALASWLLLRHPARAEASRFVHRHHLGPIVIANAIRWRND
jgi:hypothetical protein